MADLKHVQGFSQLFKNMKDLPEKLQKRAMVKGTGAAAKVIRDEARQNFRSKWKVRSGRLVRNIVLKFITELSKNGRVTFFVLVKKIKPKEMARLIKKHLSTKGKSAAPGQAFYWRYLEFGTVRIDARPFMRPAFQSKSAEAIEAMRLAIKAELDKIIAEMARR